MDALQKAQRIAQAIVRQHDTDSSMYTVAFEKEMLQDATLLVAVAGAEAARISADAAIAQAEAMTRIAVALEALAAVRAEVAADTDSLREGQMIVETSPAYLRGYFAGINCQPRWEPTPFMPRGWVYGEGEYVQRAVSVHDGVIAMRDDARDLYIGMPLPTGYALCRLVEPGEEESE